MREWLLAVALLIASTASAGCVFGCGRGVSKEWVQAGVFEEFPPKGDHGDYKVSWRDPPEFNRSVRTAQGNVDSGNIVDLSVDKDNKIRWSANSHSDESDEYTANMLRETFADLGLPAPTPAGWEFGWYQAC